MGLKHNGSSDLPEKEEQYIISEKVGQPRHMKLV